MIEITPLDGAQNLQFENYDHLFDYFVETENMKLLSKQAEYQQTDWSFTIYPPKQVSVLFTHSNGQDSAIREAYEEELPLIEICAGSYKHPTYIVNTPNIDMEYLKRKWCLDFCTYHDLILKDYAEMYRNSLRTAKKGPALSDLEVVSFQ